jgi:hypothetical protein
MNNSISIYSRLSDISQNIGAIAKTRSNSGSYGSSYRSIDDLKNHLQPELASFGVVMSTESLSLSETTYTTQDKKTGLQKLNWRTLTTIRVKFSCDEGTVCSDHSIAKNHAGDFGPKAATSIAIAQAIETVFCISTEFPQQEQQEAPQQPPQASKKQPQQQTVQKGKQPLQEDPFKKFGITEAEALQIKESIEATQKDSELQKIWDKYPQLHQVSFFLNSVKKQKARLAMPKFLQNKELKNK